MYEFFFEKKWERSVFELLLSALYHQTAALVTFHDIASSICNFESLHVDRSLSVSLSVRLCPETAKFAGILLSQFVGCVRKALEFAICHRHSHAAKEFKPSHCHLIISHPTIPEALAKGESES